ncbi:Arc family DNA-binding protein [candidate division KSB1 bacterium]|nr:Arc family DNA-binding protein [candidate division KSB1 bacterium]
MNITVRNIPEEVVNKIKTLSQKSKRSLNNEILIILEQSLQDEMRVNFKLNSHLSKDVQVSIWKKLSSAWNDERSTQDIIDDIYDSRTLGREFHL